MKRVGMRELNQHASRVIDMVRRGEAIEVTDHNRPVARIVPVVDGSAGVLRSMVGAGRAVAPTVVGEVPVPPVIGDLKRSAADEIAASRLRERW